MDYKLRVVGTCRDFEITGGLREGYGPYGRCYHHIDDVRIAHQQWMINNGLVLSIEISETILSYGSYDKAHMLSANALPSISFGVICDEEPGFSARGMIHPLYDVQLDDDEVPKRVRSLAEALASALGQQRIYCRYRDRIEILEART